MRSLVHVSAIGLELLAILVATSVLHGFRRGSLTRIGLPGVKLLMSLDTRVVSLSALADLIFVFCYRLALTSSVIDLILLCCAIQRLDRPGARQETLVFLWTAWFEASALISDKFWLLLRRI